MNANLETGIQYLNAELQSNGRYRYTNDDLLSDFTAEMSEVEELGDRLREASNEEKDCSQEIYYLWLQENDIKEAIGFSGKERQAMRDQLARIKAIVPPMQRAKSVSTQLSTPTAHNSTRIPHKL